MYANTFTYDATGNRTLNNADSARTTYSYNAANQLNYSQAAAGRTTFSYDDNDNQTVQQPPVGARTTTTWNYENQPAEYHLPDGSRTTLAYNADNRRVSKQLASSTDRFIWDPVADAYQSELNASNVTQAVYTSPPVQYGQTISQRRGSTSHWYHPDSLGSTKALTNSSQTTTDTYLYDAWDNPLSSTGTTVNPFRWVGNVGYYFDQHSGLYYIRARSYQPTVAIWTSVDPLFYIMARVGAIGLGAQSPDGFDVIAWNIYTYVARRPYIYTDPSGHIKADPSKGLYPNLPKKGEGEYLESLKCIACCCCPDKITVSFSNRTVGKKPMDGRKVFQTITINFEISLTFKPLGTRPKKTKYPDDYSCGLRFFEYPVYQGAFQIVSPKNEEYEWDVWNDAVLLIPQSKFFSNWKKLTPPKNCKGTKKVTMADESELFSSQAMLFYQYMAIEGGVRCNCKTPLVHTGTKVEYLLPRKPTGVEVQPNSLPGNRP